MTGSVEEPGRWPGSLSPFQIAMEVVVPIYRLGSNELVHAPGVVAWAINGYHFKRDRAVLRRVIVDGWPGVPDHAAQQLLSGAAPYHVDGDTVVVKVDAKSSNVPKRGERSVPMTVEMTLTEVDAGSGLLPDGVIFGTLIKACIEPIRTRDRRRTDLDLFITQLVSSMKSYFMAFEPKKETSPALERAVTRPGEGR